MKEGEFIGISKVTMIPNPDGKTSKLKRIEIILELSPNLNRSAYQVEGEFTKEGVNAMAIAFVHGLAGCIHYAHRKQFMLMSENHKYILECLQRALDSEPDVKLGKLDL